MKYIVKTSEPESLKIWKELQKETPNCNYGSLQNPEKRELHQSLLNEQGKICCYCQSRIDLDSSHIEHLKPQSLYRDESLTYQNLLASCQGEDTASRKPVHCGHKRQNEPLSVTPLDTDCEQFFVYTEDGQIFDSPNSTKSVAKTIDLLGLNIPKLQRMRKSAIANLELETLTPEDKQLLIEFYSRSDEVGDFQEFCTTILSVLQN
jgi:uncharacterized protein (TIGR02646 family)